MKRRLPFLALGALVAVLVLGPAGASAEVAWRSWDEGMREARTTGRPVLVDVYTNWCGWCKRLDRDVYSRADVQDYLSRKVVPIKLNAEGREAASWQGRAYNSRSLAAKLGVSGYPTILFFDPRGGSLGGVASYVTPEQMMSMLHFVGDGHAQRGEKYEDFLRAAERGVAPGARR
jgi:thioredoxin-related protein